MQESRWKILTRDNEEPAACSVTTEISGVIYMNLMYVGGGDFFGWVFCFVLSLEVAQCGQEGRKADRENGRKRGREYS